MKRIFLLLVILSCFVTRAVSQHQVTGHYSVSDGLPFIHIYALHQDESGRLWVGGYGGLSIFDGYSFTNLSKRDGLSSNWVTDISSITDSTYIATNNGVILHTGENSMREVGGLIGLQVSELLCTKNNKTIALSNRGVHRITQTESRLIFRSNEVKSIGYHSDTLFIASGDSLVTFDLKADSIIRSDKVPMTIRCLVWHDEKLHLGSNSGIWIKGPSWRQIRPEDGLPHPVVNDLNSNEDELWAATNYGIAIIDSSMNIEISLVGSSIKSNQCERLLHDREGQMWVGTYDGLYQMSRQSFEKIGYDKGFFGVHIYQITRDQKGNIWIGTQNNGAIEYNGKTFIARNTRHGLIGNEVTAILPLGEAIYFGTNKGVSKKSGRKFTHYTNSELGIKGVYSLLESNNSIYVGGQDGLAIIKPSGEVVRIELPTKKSFQIWDLFEDSQNQIWIATYQGGLFRLKGSKVDSIEINPEYSVDDYLSITEDSKHRLWIATFDGVYVTTLEGERLDHIHSERGLSSDLCYSLFIDREEYIWIGTNQGLNRIDLSQYELAEQPTIEQYSFSDGFTGVECNCHAAFQDQSGDLFFGSVNGLFTFDPKINSQSQYSSPASIESMQLFYHDTVLLPGAKLNYNQNHLGFNFKGVSLLNNRSNEYRYRLIGLEDEWSPPTAVREARYPNLPPGKYRFEVQHRPNNRHSFSETSSYEFEIAKAWFQEWPFIIGSFLFVIAITFFFIRWRIKLGHKQSVMDKKVESLKLQAFRSQMNPHFIFNAMNTIQYFINQNDQRQANLYLSSFAKLIRKVLQNSRANLITLEEDLEALEIYIQLEQARSEAGFDFNVNLNDCDPDDILVPPLLIQPFVENSIVHGINNIDYRGEINIEVVETSSGYNIYIRDNGIGIDASKNKPLKNKQHESIATSLTEDRIGSLRQVYGNYYDLFIRPWHEGSANPGTEIEIHIPKPKHYD